MASSMGSRQRTMSETKAEEGLAEWKQRIKQLQEQADADDQAEQKRLQTEITQSRLERSKRRNSGVRRSLGLGDIPEDLRGIVDRQQTQSDALAKLSGSSPAPVPASFMPPASTNTPPRPKPSNGSHSASDQPMSLAAFMGSSATGPRLNKHAAQQDAHDPTLYKPTQTFLSRPISSTSPAVGLPGLSDAAKLPPKWTESVGRTSPVVESPREEKPTSRPVSSSRAEASIANNRRSWSPVTARDERYQSNSPIPGAPASRSPEPVVSKPIRQTTHAPHPKPVSTTKPSPTTPAKAHTTGPHTPALARQIQSTPSAPPSFVPKSNPSPAFLRTATQKEQSPSLTRLQGRGFVEQRVKASALFETSASQSDGEISKSTAPKKAAVLSRWSKQAGSDTEGARSPPPLVSPNKPSLKTHISAPSKSTATTSDSRPHLSTTKSAPSAPSAPEPQLRSLSPYKRHSGTASDQESATPRRLPGLATTSQRPISIAQQVTHEGISSSIFPSNPPAPEDPPRDVTPRRLPGLATTSQRPYSIAQQVSHEGVGSAVFPFYKPPVTEDSPRDVTPRRLPGLASTNTGGSVANRLSQLMSSSSNDQIPIVQPRPRTRSVHFTPDVDAETTKSPRPSQGESIAGPLTHLTKDRARKPKRAGATDASAPVKKRDDVTHITLKQSSPHTSAFASGSTYSGQKRSAEHNAKASPSVTPSVAEQYVNPWAARDVPVTATEDRSSFRSKPASTPSWDQVIETRLISPPPGPSDTAPSLQPIIAQSFPETSTPWPPPSQSQANVAEAVISASDRSHSSDIGRLVDAWADHAPIAPRSISPKVSTKNYGDLSSVHAPVPAKKMALPGLATTTPAGSPSERNINQSPPRPKRIPSTGSRPTVMDVAQVMHETPTDSPLQSPLADVPPTASQLVESDVEPLRLDVKSAIASWGKPESQTPVESKRRSILDEFPAVPQEPVLSLVMPDASAPSEEIEEEEDAYVDVKTAIANWGVPQSPSTAQPRPNANTGPQQAERRRSHYEKYASIILPPLKEEKTPNPTPAGSLFKPSNEHATRPDLASAVQALAAVDDDGHSTTHSRTSSHVLDSSGSTLFTPSDPHVRSVSQESAKSPVRELITLKFDDPPLPSFALDPFLNEAQPSSDAANNITLSVEVFSIAGSVSTSISTDHNVFYEGEFVAVVHRIKAKTSGLVSTTVWGWRGRTAEGEREIRKQQELAQRFGTSAIECRQGSELTALVEVLGGTLITRQGTRAHWAAENTAMHCVRAIGKCVFIDQVDLEITNLCSAFSYCVSVLDALHVWHGRGATMVEREAASAYAKKLATDSVTCTEFDEGNEEEMFWMMLGEEPYANSSCWSFKLDSDTVQPKLYRIDASKHGKSVVPIRQFSARHIDNASILVFDGLTEIFVIVGANARGQRTSIRLALVVAQNISAITAEKRPFPAPVHVLVLPSQVPLDLRSRFRYLDEEELNQGNIPDHMNLLTLAEAMDQLSTTSWTKVTLEDDNYLPLGVSPASLRTLRV